MGAATTARDAQGGQRAGLWARLGIHRDDERALMASAAPVFALASAGAAMSTTTADAMFLSEIGPAHLGEAMVVSSALLAIVLGIVGGLADRLERRRILATLAVVSAVVLASLAALSFELPQATALLTMIVGKQLAAASDLAFWVVIGERLDARRSRRLLPVLAAAGGAGAAIGAVVVKPIADALGAPAVLLCAAVLLALAGAGAMRFAATRRVAPTGSRSAGALIARSWRDGARAVRRQPLARQLAILVAAAGVFASLAYFALGIAVASQTDILATNKAEAAADLAGLLGTIRSGSQILVLVFQLLVAPRLLARIGTGNALLLAPLIALAAGVGLVIAPILAIAIATQVSARVLDSGIEAPAEKLALTLIPTSTRGRIGGFLDGPAKRIGNIAGGAIAALLAGDPTVFYVVTAIAAGLWLIAATRMARELPALAISHVAAGDDADVEAVVDARAVEALRKELDGPRPERAAELFARLHERGRVDAVPDLVKAATVRGGPALWRALITTLDEPAEAHGPALAAAAKTCADTELAVRAVGLAGGVSTDELAAWLAAQDAALALTAEIAKLRLDGDHAGALARMSDAVRDSGPTGRVATEELGVEIARALAAPSIDSDRVFEATRHLARALRRGRGDVASRAAGFNALARVVAWAREQRNAELALLRADLLELARERVEAGATPTAPETALTSLIRSPAKTDDAIEVAASIRLMGALLEGADAVEPEDLRRVARALGEPDDDVRAAAEDALTALGPVAAGELMATAAWGRRRARDRAAALLAELPVTPAAIDRLIDAELDALDTTHAAISVLREPGDELLARRLDERMREIAHTVLLLVAARRRSPSIARAAAAWGHARGALERARTLAVVEAALPRSLVVRLVDAVDELSPADRAAALERAGGVAPSRDVVVRTELAGRDRLARALALHMIGAAGRSAHRDTIAGAAHAEVQAATAADLLRRVTDAISRDPEHVPEDDGGTDMPTRVESLIALGRVPLLAALTTRQLADVAERARWVNARAGSVVVTSGDAIDALILVEDGELALGERRIVKGEVVDELACVAPASVTHDLKAVRATRMLRLERVDFEELVDDVPGLAASVCRALGERARRAEEGNYKSPLSSRV